MSIKYAIFGHGGFAREVLSLICNIDQSLSSSSNVSFITNNEDYIPEVHGKPIIAIGNGNIRKNISNYLISKFPNIEFPNIIHPSAFIGVNVRLGVGCIITQNCVLTTDINLGNFCHLNLATTVGHDVNVGNYFTSAPGVHVNGNVDIEENVYMGSNSCTIEKINICSNVILGAGAVVASSILEQGTYVGVPARLIRK